MNIIVTGSLGYDYIMDFPGKFVDRIMPDKIHKLSLGFLVDKLTKNFGGTAGNIAYTLKLLGINPFILSCAGNDFLPYKNFLRKQRISVRFIKEISIDVTGSYFVVTDQEDNQIGAFYTGAMKNNRYLTLMSFPRMRESLLIHKQIDPRWSLPSTLIEGKDDKVQERPDFVIISPNDPKAMLRHVREAKELKLPYMYDPAFQIDIFSVDELQDGIEHAAILIGNDYEISLIKKKLNISHQKLIKLCPIVITTLGSQGSIIDFYKSSSWGAKRLQDPQFTDTGHASPSVDGSLARMTDRKLLKISVQAAKPINTSDPTGAGDAYRAGFLAGYLRGFDLKICGQMGSTAAVYTVEKYGTQTHTFTINEFCQRYAENYQDNLRID